MTMNKKIALFATLIMALAMSGTALAHGFHGSRVHFGFAFGGPVFYPAPYYYPPAYYPPTVYEPAAPTTYIEKSQDAGSEAAQSYWYYCPEAKAYYPYVKQCAGGWQPVTPRAPTQ